MLGWDQRDALAGSAPWLPSGPARSPGQQWQDADVDPLHEVDRRAFGSDNHAGVHPEVLEALVAANGGDRKSVV